LALSLALELRGARCLCRRQRRKRRQGRNLHQRRCRGRRRRLRAGRCLGRSPAAGSYARIGLRRCLGLRLERRRERGVALAQLLDRAREQLRRGKKQMGLGRLEGRA